MNAEIIALPLPNLLIKWVNVKHYRVILHVIRKVEFVEWLTNVVSQMYRSKLWIQIVKKWSFVSLLVKLLTHSWLKLTILLYVTIPAIKVQIRCYSATPLSALKLVLNMSKFWEATRTAFKHVVAITTILMPILEFVLLFVLKIQLLISIQVLGCMNA